MHNNAYIYGLTVPVALNGSIPDKAMYFFAGKGQRMAAKVRFAFMTTVIVHSWAPFRVCLYILPLALNKILVIEDERDMANAISEALALHGYSVVCAESAETGEDMLHAHHFDLILLDIRLPGMDGFEMCRNIRNRDDRVPVIMLTACGDEFDRVFGLEIGADDYLIKPFSLRELIARIKVRLRRSEHQPSATKSLSFGELRIDLKNSRVFLKEHPVALTTSEFGILKLLVEERPYALSRETLLQRVWGYSYYPNLRIVDNHILNLRKKLESDPRQPSLIVTRHGAGYCFAG